MIERFVMPFIAVVTAMLLQSGLAPHLAIGGVTPNFLLIVVVTIALTGGSTEGALTGFFAGLAFDLIGTGPVGAMALVLAVSGYLAGTLHSAMFAEGWLLPLTVLSVTALVSEMAYAVMLDVLGADIPFWRSAFTTMLPGAIYNTLLALLVYPWLARFLRQERPMKMFRRLA